MTDINNQIQAVLQQLSERLRTARLDRNETQEIFAARLGISRQTYSKMENGAPTTPIGHWLTASALLRRLESWDGVLAEPEDLFAQFEREQKGKQRASSKGRKKR